MEKINKNEIIWFGILLCFTLYLQSLLETDKIGVFIHPRMNKYILFACISFGILTINQIRRVFLHTKNTKIKPGYALFLLPLVLGIGVNPQTLNAEVTATKGIQLSSNAEKQTPSYAEVEQSTPEPEIKQTISNEEIPQIPSTKEATPEVLPENDEEEEIVGNTGNFLEVVGRIYGNSYEENRGKKIRMTGFVYKDETFGENQFIIGRMAINCCAADAQVVGLICEYDKDKIPDNDQWVEIVGGLDETEYVDPLVNESLMYPCIQVETIKPVEAPDSPYVYDSFND